MAKKILIIANGAPLDICGLFVFALEEKIKEIVNWTGSLVNMSYNTEVDTKRTINRYIPTEKIDLSQFDAILGLDNQCIPILINIKENFNNKIVGCQILDYPAHVFKKNKDHNNGAEVLWDNIKTQIGKLDFIIHNKKIAIDLLKEYHSNSNYDFIRFPVNPIYFDKFERKDFIVYSGRLHPDKGVHYIIDALSIIENSPEFVTIGSGYDFNSYAEFLGVKYKNIENCSEKNKWLLYHQCRFLVCASDNEYITALSILEGISIGRSAVVFDYKENREHFYGFVSYCKPRNIDSLASSISYMFKNKERYDNKAKNGYQFYKEELSYEVWASKVKDLIDRTMQ